jgi:hypothetical protein
MFHTLLPSGPEADECLSHYPLPFHNSFFFSSTKVALEGKALVSSGTTFQDAKTRV